MTRGLISAFNEGNQKKKIVMPLIVRITLDSDAQSLLVTGYSFQRIKETANARVLEFFQLLF